MRRRLMPALGLGVLRAVALTTLILLLVNPVRSRPGGEGAPPLVLLDASLSMGGAHGAWSAALDSARRLAALTGGVIWRFGETVAVFDTSSPSEGASRLGPALAAAAGRPGPVIVVTDGAVTDSTDLPADLRRRSRILVLPRAAFVDRFVASVNGPRHVASGDTVRLRVAYGTAGPRQGGGRRSALVVERDGLRLVAQPVVLPDSGTLATDIVLPPGALPGSGLQALRVRLEGPGDVEPRDDARLFVLEVSAQPTAVVLGSPPGWESRFFAKVLADVARVPVKSFVEVEPSRWRDAATMAETPAAAVARLATGARFLALIGDAGRLAVYRRRSGLVWWPLPGAVAGDWYVDAPPASTLAGSLAGVAWDSLPPAAALTEVPRDPPAASILTARLARRGSPRPLVLVRDSAGARAVIVAGEGLWRWSFRGGAAGEGYRSLVATISDWLLADPGTVSRGRFEPVTLEVANGLPLLWRWRGREPAQRVPLALESASGSIAAALAFDADGRADLRLPPGIYRWRALDGPERGLVAVEQYSDEWRPAAATLTSQPGQSGGPIHEVAARELWWLFALALLALVAEWAWRRRQGLP